MRRSTKAELAVGTVELFLCVAISVMVAVSDSLFGPYSFYMAIGVVAMVTAIVGITWAVIRVLRGHDL